MRLTELVGSSGSSANDREEIRFAKDSPLEEGVTSEPVSEFPQAISFRLVFTLPNAGARARARGKVDAVTCRDNSEIICGI